MQLSEEIGEESENPKVICGKELKNLKRHLLPVDRKMAVATFKINYVTVSRYLNGNVGNLARGIKLLNFFSRRINKRTNELKALSQKRTY
jgi:hypothetical protein